MMRGIAIAVTFLCAFLTVVYWGDPAGFGWVCAMAGWSQHCFKERS